MVLCGWFYKCRSDYQECRQFLVLYVGLVKKWVWCNQSSKNNLVGHILCDHTATRRARSWNHFPYTFPPPKQTATVLQSELDISVPKDLFVNDSCGEHIKKDGGNFAEQLQANQRFEHFHYNIILNNVRR